MSRKQNIARGYRITWGDSHITVRATTEVYSTGGKRWRAVAVGNSAGYFETTLRDAARVLRRARRDKYTTVTREY